MSTSEILVMLVAFGVGYWLVSVFLPLLRSRGTPAEAAAPAPPQDVPWFEVLDVAPDASREQIVAAYKRRIGQYHPDKVQHLGPELVRLAEVHAKQINAAYESALRQLRDA